jgi:hypothetical protein
MTGEHPIRRENSTLVLFCQVVHALPMREMVLLGEGMTHRHNIPQKQEKTIRQNHMSGRPLRARPDGAAGFALQSAWLAALAAAELASAADASARALRARPRAADPPRHWAATYINAVRKRKLWLEEEQLTWSQF